jgi:hypothetical protein
VFLKAAAWNMRIETIHRFLEGARAAAQQQAHSQLGAIGAVFPSFAAFQSTLFSLAEEPKQRLMEEEEDEDRDRDRDKETEQEPGRTPEPETEAEAEAEVGGGAESTLGDKASDNSSPKQRESESVLASDSQKASSASEQAVLFSDTIADLETTRDNDADNIDDADGGGDVSIQSCSPPLDTAAEVKVMVKGAKVEVEVGTEGDNIVVQQNADHESHASSTASVVADTDTATVAAVPAAYTEPPFSPTELLSPTTPSALSSSLPASASINITGSINMTSAVAAAAATISAATATSAAVPVSSLSASLSKSLMETEKRLEKERQSQAKQNRLSKAFARLVLGSSSAAEEAKVAVPLGTFREGRLGMKPGRKGEVIPV